MITHTLRLSTPKAHPPLEVSKWLRIQLLIDEEEMKNLMEAMPPFFHFAIGGVMKREESQIAPELFLKEYGEYISSLKTGVLPDDTRLIHVAPSVWSVDPEALYAIPVGETDQLVKIAQPVIQIQFHRFDYSPFDGKFRTMIMGKEAVMWGLQFSYPQLYKNPATQEVVMLNDPKEFANTGLFKQVQRWVRDHTTATPFMVNNEKVNVPIRLGRKCFAWINKHPQLAGKSLFIAH